MGRTSGTPLRMGYLTTISSIQSRSSTPGGSCSSTSQGHFGRRCPGRSAAQVDGSVACCRQIRDVKQQLHTWRGKTIAPQPLIPVPGAQVIGTVSIKPCYRV